MVPLNMPVWPVMNVTWPLSQTISTNDEWTPLTENTYVSYKVIHQNALYISALWIDTDAMFISSHRVLLDTRTIHISMQSIYAFIRYL